MTTDTSRPAPGQGDLLSAFGRLWWLVLVLVLIGVGAGVAWAVYSPQQYSSRVTLVVQLPPDGEDPEALVRTVEALMTSNVVLADIVDGSGVDLSTTQVEDRITIERPAGSAVIEVAVRDTSGERVEALADEVVPALENAIDGLQTLEGTGMTISVTSLQDSPVVVSDDRQPVRYGALGGLAGFILGILVVAVLSGRRASRTRLT